MADVTLREATPDDVDGQSPSANRTQSDDAAELAAAYRDAYRQNRELGFPAKAGSATEAAVGEWIREHRVFVAESDAGVVGGVRLEHVDVAEQSSAGNQKSLISGDEGVMKLSRLGVRERWKGEGIGSRLLEHAEQVAREAGYGTMRLTTPDEHPFLPEFYHAHGYEMTGEYPLAYREYDEVVMEKSLG